MGSLIRTVPFNPFITGSLWLLLTQAPPNIREPVLQWLRKRVSAATIRHAISALKWLFAIGIASRTHSFLTELAQNNWRWRSERQRYDWPKETAVITGAASGFGSLISKSLAEKGVNIMALDIAEKLPADMESNPKIHYYRCNVIDRQAVMDTAARIREAHGDPSILVNNAGVSSDGTITDSTEAMVRRTFEVNLISHYWTLAAFLPSMLSAKKGHVVTLASMASFITPPGMGPYCNTKAALVSLHEGLQAEARTLYDAPEVKFSIIHPYFAATAMTKPYEAEFKRTGTVLLEPEVVSDAIVKQILSCRGRQIVVPGEATWTSTIRALPSYVSSLLYMLIEKDAKETQAAMEKVRSSK